MQDPEPLSKAAAIASQEAAKDGGDLDPQLAKAAASGAGANQSIAVGSSY